MIFASKYSFNLQAHSRRDDLISLGFVLLLGGKMHFSDIETAFIVGNILLYFLFNYMNKVNMS